MVFDPHVHFPENIRTTFSCRAFQSKEVAAHLSQFAYQWEKSVNNAIERMRRQASSFVHEELEIIESLLSGTKDHTDEIRSLINQIEAAEAINRLAASCRGMK